MLLKADEKMVSSLATGPEADNDPKLTGGIGSRLGDARNVRAGKRGTAQAHLGGGGAQGVRRTYSDWDA